MTHLSLEPSDLAALGGRAGRSPGCPRCTISLGVFEDRPRRSWWYRCSGCGWSGGGADLLAAAWSVEPAELPGVLAGRRLDCPRAADEAERGAAWRKTADWLGERAAEPLPDQEHRREALRLLLPGLSEPDWQRWKRGPGRFVFLASLAELPHRRWTGAEGLTDTEFFLAAPVVDHLERPAGLWAYNGRGHALFPSAASPADRHGYVLLAETPRDAVFVAGRAEQVLRDNVLRARVSPKPHPVVPVVWCRTSGPDRELPPEARDARVLAYQGDVASFALAVAKRQNVILETRRGRTPCRSVESRTPLQVGWEEAAILEARRQGGALRAWAAQAGLDPAEEFVRLRAPDVYRELTHGHEAVAGYGGWTVLARDDGVHVRRAGSAADDHLITNALPRVVALYPGNARRVYARCEGTVDGKKFAFELPAADLTKKAFAERLAAEALGQARRPVYVARTWAPRLGGVIMALWPIPEGVPSPSLFGWNHANKAFRLGDFTVSAKGNVRSSAARCPGPKLAPFKSDPDWVKLLGRRREEVSSLWAAAAVCGACLVAQQLRIGLPDRVGFVGASPAAARWLPLKVLGLGRPADAAGMPGWPHFGSDAGPRKTARLRAVTADAHLASRVAGRSWWAALARGRPHAREDLGRAAARILPGWVQYYVRHRFRPGSSDRSLPVLVLESMAGWFQSLGGSGFSVREARDLIHTTSGGGHGTLMAAREVVGAAGPAVFRTEGGRTVVEAKEFLQFFPWVATPARRGRLVRRLITAGFLDGRGADRSLLLVNQAQLEAALSGRPELRVVG